MSKRAIKECIKIPLDNIRIFPDALVRQSLLKAPRNEKIENIKELADSMKAVGLLQPIGVVFLVENDGEKFYQLVLGYRRFLAAEYLEWKKILACVLNPN